VSPDRTITADSLAVSMPNQRVNEVHAIRRAYAETSPDTMKLKSAQRDWLRGDTIVAALDSALTADTSSKPRIRELFANGNASSFYQIPSNKGPTAPPSVNYVRGRTITVNFVSQEVQSVIVEEQAAGIFAEPAADSTGKKQPARPGTPATGGRQQRPPATRPPSGAPRP
jgi:hypothetical protein